MQHAVRRSTSTRSRTSRAAAAHQDAIALLKSDHREVEGWFEQFSKTRSSDRKADLAKRICQALRIHTTIEEEIFYPAFLEATRATDIHHEAEIEHQAAKDLIGRIEAAGPADDYFASQVHVLAEMIKHHVREEEKRDGMFAKARASDMDLQELGDRLRQRKLEMQAAGKAH
jgi:hemerythrin superfamily protein